MRQFLLIAFLFCLKQSIISQNLNVAEHLGVDASGELVNINSKSYYLSDSRIDCYSSAYLACLNDSGRTIGRYPFGTRNFNYFGRLIKTHDGALFLSGSSAGSTDIGPYEELVVKMDTNGNTLFRTSVLPGTADLYPSVNSIAQHQDSSYYLVCSSSAVLHVSKSGQLLPQINTGLTLIRTVTALVNGNLLLNGLINNVRHNVIITPTGSILAQQICSNRIIKYMEYPNYILALTTNGYIEKYSSSLTLQNTSVLALDPAYNKISDFFTRSDSIFVTGTTVGSQNPFYAIVDSNFVMKYLAISTYKGVRPTGICVTNKNAIHIITTSASKSAPLFSFVSSYRLGLTGAFLSSSDIGVIAFSNVNTRLLGNGSPGTWVTPYIETDVTVKNFGLDTVRRFYLNHYVFLPGTSSYCYILLHKEVQVPIAPGAMISVPTGSFYGHPFAYGTAIGSIKLNMCIFTTVPNGRNDIEIDNDAFCDSVLFTVTGIDENRSIEQSANVFPNPFNTSFTIQSDVEIIGYCLYNALGEMVEEEKMRAKTFTMRHNDLSTGIYFVKVETEKGVTTKKIIKN